MSVRVRVRVSVRVRVRLRVGVRVRVSDLVGVGLLQHVRLDQRRAADDAPG